jgi:hypothetical protein
MNKDAFMPTFGNRPFRIVGREEIINEFVTGLAAAPGHPDRATIFIGQRGMGKTALLLEFADRASHLNFVPVRVTASERMLDEILQIIQVDGAKFVSGKKRNVKAVSAGVLGFSFGLTFSDDTIKNYGFRVKFTMLVDELAKHDKGVLLLVDEVQSDSPQMRELATTYQHLVGDGKNIAIAMAGLPGAVSSILHDSVLTFLNRARKVFLGPIALPEIAIFYAECFSELKMTINEDVLMRAVTATEGYPYLLQLIGYYILKYANDGNQITEDIVSRAIKSSKHDLIESVHTACLNPLSDKDIEFLKAMSGDKTVSSVAEIQKRLGESQGYIQQYRKRLMDAGIVSSARRGKLEMTVPFLAEYLRGELQ